MRACLFYPRVKPLTEDQLKKFAFIIPLLFLLSCSVQKRHYQKGFYVSNSFQKKSSKQEQGKEKIVTTVFSSTNNSEELLLASALPNLVLAKHQILSTINPDSLCDIIILKNGNDVKAKVLEITPIEVKYKKCLSPDGPLYIVKKADVFMIKYSNGTKEVIGIEQTNETTKTTDEIVPDTSYTGPKTMHPKAKSALIFACFGLIPLLGILACVKAIVDAGDALNDIKQNPNRYTGERRAKNAKKLAFAFLLISFGILFIIRIAI